MEGAKSREINKIAVAAQLCLRLVAAVFALAASFLTFTNREDTMFLGFYAIHAKYSDSSAFVYLAWASIAVCIFSVLSFVVVLCLIRRREAVSPTHYFYLFLHDLVTMTVLISACAAATSIGLVAQFGIKNSGWSVICDKVAKFCRKGTISLACAYISFGCYVLLAVLSARKLQA